MNQISEMAIDLSKLPPGPKPVIPLSNFIRFRRDSLGFLKKAAQEYGDVVYFKVGPLRMVLLNHPDFIKEVLSTQHSNFVKGRLFEMIKEVLGEGLLTSEGAFHKRQSRIMQPAFHHRMMSAYAPAMTEYAARIMNGWQDGMKVDMMKEMVKMSTGIAAKTMFNVDMEKDAKEINEALEVIMGLFGRVTLPFAGFMLKLPLPGTLRFFKAKALLDKTIFRIIEERRYSKLYNGDILSLLLQTQEDPNSGGMSDLQIRDEALTLFLAGFDTSSLAFIWTWYLLSQNPAAEAELHEELDRVLQGRMPTLEDNPRLKFTRMVIEESMRLYPPIYMIVRQAMADFSVGKYVVPQGTIVLMSPYLIQRDARFHPNPEQFNPRNSAKCPGGQYQKYEYFPFSAGPRSCIGQQYAWLEGVMVLATIAQNWRFTLLPEHPVEMAQLLNLRPKNGMMMRLHKRK